MFFSRRFQKFFSLLALLLWVHMDACAAYALVSQNSSPIPFVKTTPLAAQSSSSTGEKRAATIFLGGKYYTLPVSSPDNAEVSRLFDRNTETAYTPADSALVDFRFESAQTINEIRLYGPSSYILTVQQQINGQWLGIEDFAAINLSANTEQWYSYPLETSEQVDALRLQLVPIDNSGTAGDTSVVQGIREIEFWSPGQHEPVWSGIELHSLLDQGVVVNQSRRYQAEPASGIIGPEAGEYKDIASDNTFRFDLASDSFCSSGCGLGLYGQQGAGVD
jgi:hypothetical protein